MSEVLYEQYKDALRRGHVAALRGRLDVAAAAYREATRIAPDRALPYVGLGGVLTRLGKADDALAAYATALDHSPTDEGAMQGSADVLVALGRPAEAAETLDRLAVILEQDDRLADACDVARSALEL
ncbi:MAG: protein O-GlcNAc transferase, partial [Chloroflexota bacterium]|nr:protein O-GlcNAc transferase [Chloroflexota bacterium]